MKYDIWTEGWAATGGHGTAQCIARGVEGETFKDACKNWFTRPEYDGGYGNYNEETNSVWGCRLFDNHADAARAFG